MVLCFLHHIYDLLSHAYILEIQSWTYTLCLGSVAFVNAEDAMQRSR